MGTESLIVALEREHREVDEGIEAFTGGPPGGERDRRPLMQAIDALRRHIYLEEVFLFPPLRAAGLVAPVLVMLREHAQMWQTLDSLERELDAGGTGGTVLTLCRRLAVQLLHHNLKEERILYPRADDDRKLAACEGDMRPGPGWARRRVQMPGARRRGELSVAG